MLGTVGIYAGMRGWKPEQLVYALGAERITEENARACGLESKLFEGSREGGYYGFFLHADCTPLVERPNASCLAFRGMEWYDNEEEPDVDHVCEMRFIDKDGNATRTITPGDPSNHSPLSVFSVATNTILCYSPYGLIEDSDGTEDSDTPVCSPLQALRVNLLTHATDVVTIVPASPDVEAKMGEFLSKHDNGPEYVQLGRLSEPGQYAVLLAVYTPGFDPDPCMQIGTIALA
jgi:hypothetical protein